MHWCIPNRPTNCQWTITSIAFRWDCYAGGCNSCDRLLILLNLLFFLTILFFILFNFTGSLVFLVNFCDFTTLWLHIKGFTIDALVYWRVLCYRTMTLQSTSFDSYKKSHIKVNRQTKVGFDYFSVSVCHLTNHMQNHSQCKLMTVLIWKWNTTVFVWTHVWSSCT
jgi:hypothetical protein